MPINVETVLKSCDKLDRIAAGLDREGKDHLASMVDEAAEALRKSAKKEMSVRKAGVKDDALTMPEIAELTDIANEFRKDGQKREAKQILDMVKKAYKYATTVQETSAPPVPSSEASSEPVSASSEATGTSVEEPPKANAYAGSEGESESSESSESSEAAAPSEAPASEPASEPEAAPAPAPVTASSRKDSRKVLAAIRSLEHRLGTAGSSEACSESSESKASEAAAPSEAPAKSASADVLRDIARLERKMAGKSDKSEAKSESDTTRTSSTKEARDIVRSLTEQGEFKLARRIKKLLAR